MPEPGVDGLSEWLWIPGQLLALRNPELRKRVIRAFDSEGHTRFRYKNTIKSVRSEFCGNELILEFPTKSMPSGFRATPILDHWHSATPAYQTEGFGAATVPFFSSA
jgi:hypothetical protein